MLAARYKPTTTNSLHIRPRPAHVKQPLTSGEKKRLNSDEQTSKGFAV